MDIITLSLAKKYANKVAAGFSKVEVQGNNLIFTLNDGTKATMTVPTPEKGSDGISIVDVSIDIDGSLLCHMSDGSTINAGKIAEYDEHSQELDNKIIDTRNELERVKNDVLETGTDTDTYIHLEDSAMAEYQELSVDGVCEQETTSGKNLFDESIMPTNTMNGIKWEYTNKKIKISGTATDTYSNNENIPITLQAGTYYFVKSTATNVIFVARFYNIDGELIANSQRYNPFTISENATRMELLVKGITSGTLYNQEINFMVSTTNGNYEPYTGGEPSPSPDYPQEIKTIENSLKITSNNGELEDSENYLFSQIQANLPEGEFIGKINDTNKDELSIVYNEKDGQYHLILNKMISKVTLDGNKDSISMPNQYRFNIDNAITDYLKIDTYKNYSLSDKYIVVNQTSTNSEFDRISSNYNYAVNFGAGVAYNVRIKDVRFNSINDFKNELKANPIIFYYILAIDSRYTVDLGVVDMPLSYNEVTNIFTDSDLLPQINAKYYRNFVKTVQNLQINEKTLKQELIDINNRLSALETAQTSVISESEVVE